METMKKTVKIVRKTSNNIVLHSYNMNIGKDRSLKDSHVSS